MARTTAFEFADGGSLDAMQVGMLEAHQSRSAKPDLAVGPTDVASTATSERITSSSKPPVQLGDGAIALEWSPWLACHQRVEAKALAGAVEEEEALHEHQEDIQPRPFSRMLVQAKP